MNLQVASFLAQDGVVSGAIYALLALSLILVFSVTRIFLLPQGQFFVYGALTLAFLQEGRPVATAWLLLALGVATFVVEALSWRRQSIPRAARYRAESVLLLYPVLMVGLLHVVDMQRSGLLLQVIVTLAIVAPMGPMIYRLCFQPIADASVVTLLIIATSVDFVMVGLGLLFFGAEGFRATPFSTERVELASVSIPAQSLLIVAMAGALILGLYLFFGHSMQGKALRATAFNPTGARLLGIRPTAAGRLAFILAAAIGAASGVLAAPITTVYYDSGFSIGMKGFVAAVVGGIASYPAAAVGALFIGLLEAGASFYWSSYRDAIVFSLIIPMLLWLSLRSTAPLDDHE
jgi:branched-chain amino acid transport system permease protein